jgi:hypothetical protein
MKAAPQQALATQAEGATALVLIRERERKTVENEKAYDLGGGRPLAIETTSLPLERHPWPPWRREI